jgi:predicted chitinase
MMVLRLQHLLARVGYEPGALDGQWGKRTRRAVLAAEQDVGLPKSGALSGPLIASLEQRVSRQVARVPRIDMDQMARISGTFPAAHLIHLRAALIEIAATPLRAAHFVAQLAHESDRFKAMEEYASGAAYEGRADLGNTEPGDGIRYKGRGVIQLTGRANYSRAADYLGLSLVEQPGLAALPGVAYQTAAMYWLDRNINADADADDLRAVTRRINGGTNGLKDREHHLRRTKEVLRVNIT